MKIECTDEQKEGFINFAETNAYCPFDYMNESGEDCSYNADCRFCLNDRIKWIKENKEE